MTKYFVHSAVPPYIYPLETTLSVFSVICSFIFLGMTVGNSIHCCICSKSLVVGISKMHSFTPGNR